MAKDIKFYDMELNRLYILPPYIAGKNTGYISMNVKKEYNDVGSMELLYFDNELVKIVEKHNANIIVSWGDFQGIVSGYQNTDKQYKIYGTHLNGLLHRAVIPTLSETTKQAEALARDAISKIDWLELGVEVGLAQNVTYETKSYMTADEYISKLLDLVNGGYEIVADFISKTFTFNVLKPTETNFMLLENNLNAYNFEIVHNNKSLAYGGWYPQKDSDGNEIWSYITLDSTKLGVDKVDTVLSASTYAEAMAELKEYKAEHSIKADTRNIKFGVDYGLGSIIRLQMENKTEKKLVKAVSIWQENSYGEEPELTEYNEEAANNE